MNAFIIFDAYSSFSNQYLNEFRDFRIDVKQKVADIAASLLGKSLQEVRKLREDLLVDIEKYNEKFNTDLYYVENIPYIIESVFTYTEKLEAILCIASYRFYYEVFETLN